jgi:surfactin synthase thioesterase subunit
MTKLLLFAHLGCAASAYRTLLAPVVTDYECVAVDLPGCGLRHAESQAIDLMQTATLEARRIAHDAEPIVLFGHSLGALVAFEVARRRQAMGRSVAGLIVSGRRAPDVLVSSPPSGERTDAELLSFLRQMGATPEVVLADQEMMAFFLPVLRAGFRMLDSYRYVPEPVLRCPLLVLGGIDDPMVGEAELAGWSRCAQGPIAVARPPGGHMFPLAGKLAWTHHVKAFASAVVHT